MARPLARRSSFRLTRNLALVALVGTAALLGGAAAPRPPEIIEITGVPGGTDASISCVSKNGRFAGGINFTPGANRGFIWREGGSVVDLGLLPGGTGTWCSAISDNGDAATGLAFFNQSPLHAFLWTRQGGMLDLGVLPGAQGGSEGYGISKTGDVVVGVADSPGGYRAFRWTARDGMVNLGVLPGGTYSFGLNVSGNGEVTVGFGDSPDGEVATRWRRGQIENLGALHPGEYSAAIASNHDGSAITGYSGATSFLWRNGAMQDLGNLPGGSFSIGYAISDQGRVVGGGAETAEGEFVASLWTPAHGWVDLNTYLPSQGVDLTGWELSTTTGLSVDGTTMVGVGLRNGEPAGWIVKLNRLD